MKITKFTVKACCGKQNSIFMLDGILSKELMNELINLSFKEQEHFTKAGIMYLESEFLILTGPIGSNRLQIKCRKTDCLDAMNQLENFLSKF